MQLPRKESSSTNKQATMTATMIVVALLSPPSPPALPTLVLGTELAGVLLVDNEAMLVIVVKYTEVERMFKILGVFVNNKVLRELSIARVETLLELNMFLVTGGKLLEITITLVDTGKLILVEVGSSLERDVVLVVIESITALVDMRIILKETMALVDMEMLLKFEFVIPMYKEHKTHMSQLLSQTL